MDKEQLMSTGDPDDPLIPRLDTRDYSSYSDGELVSLMTTGQAEALVYVVVDRCGGTLKALAQSYRYDGDLIQEVCLRLFGRKGDWSKLKTWKGKGALDGWVRAIAIRICLDRYRELKKQTKRFERLLDSGEYQPKSFELADIGGIEAEVTTSSILRAIDELGDRDRSIILDHCLGDPPKTFEDFGMTENAFKTAKSRARDRLRTILRRKGNDYV